MKQWLTVFLGIGVTAAGCGGDGGMCGDIYDKFMKCEKEEREKEGEDEDRKIPPRKQFVAFCENSEGEEKEHWKELHKCTKEPDCESLKKCEDEVSSARRAKQRIEDIEKAMKKEDWKEAFTECRYSYDEIKANEALAKACDDVFATALPRLMETKEGADEVNSACRYSEELKTSSTAFAKACTDLGAKMIETKTKEAIGFRDRGERDFQVCYDLKELATAVGGDTQKQAEALCAEVDAAPNIKAALDGAKAAIASRTPSIPYDCGYAMTSLAAIQPPTEWAKARQDEVARTCWVELGKVVLEAKIPEMTNSNYCVWEVSQLRTDVATYQLAGKDPAFDELLVKTDAICGPR